jgi:RNA polymerase sigma factor (sigma-70 family)
MQKNAQTAEQNEDSAHLTHQKAVSAPADEPVEVSDESLAGRLRHGDRAAAEVLVDRYYERIYLFMRAVGHDRQISEDLTQETFMQAWNHIGQLRDGKALSGWLFRIAANVSRLYWRKHKGTGAAALDEIDMPLGGPNGLDGASGQEEYRRVRDAVTRLPRKLQEAIVLHYIEQLTISEAAEVAGVRQGTLKSRLNRGLVALRKEIGSP